MIFGVGTDLLAIQRVRDLLAKHGERFAARVLAVPEMQEYHARADQPEQAARLVAKRFAVKEALGKALGMGVAVPATFHASWLSHDALGKPLLCFDPTLDAWLAERQLRVHVSLSDEQEHVLAFVVAETDR